MKNRDFLDKISLFLFPFNKNKGVYICALLIILFWFFPSVIIVIFIEKIIGALSQNNQELFFSLLWMGGGTFFVYEIIFFLTRKGGWTKIVHKVQKTIHDVYMEKYIQIDNNYIEKIGTGKAIAVISSGIKTWGELTLGVIHHISSLIVSGFFSLYMISKISLKLGILFLVLLIIGFLISFYLNKLIIESRKKRIEHKNLGTKHLLKILMSKFEVLQSQKIKKEVNYLNERQESQIFYNKKMATPLAFFYRIPDIISYILLLGVFLYFGKLYFSGEVELSLLVGISGAIIIIQKTLTGSFDFFKIFTKDFAEIENLWEFFDNAPLIKGYNNGEKFIYCQGNIELKNISFGYTQGKRIFNNFSLKIEGEKVLALVGNSGSGKSTLAKMISGYMNQTLGEIIIDNQKLSEVSLKSYYKDIGYLTQDPSVFDGTIFENLTYALGEEISDEKIKEIIIQAKCEFIYDLPSGLDTQIGERGVKLSGGQKQRLAIAKIFLKNPKIIILDEPTSALDSFSEEQITKAMQNLFKNRTVIVIAHRLQTVKHADRILVLENGKIIEDGKHDELVEKNGKYAKMLELQSGF